MWTQKEVDAMLAADEAQYIAIKTKSDAKQAKRKALIKQGAPACRQIQCYE